MKTGAPMITDLLPPALGVDVLDAVEVLVRLIAWLVDALRGQPDGMPEGASLAALELLLARDAPARAALVDRARRNPVLAAELEAIAAAAPRAVPTIVRTVQEIHACPSEKT